MLAALRLTAVALLAGCGMHLEEPEAVRTAERRFVAADGAEGEWRAVTLPDRWNHPEGRAVEAHYRVTFRLDRAPAESWAVLLPELRMNAAVAVNGHAIGDGGRFAEPIARNWNRPLLFRIPARLLHEGGNEVAVRVATPATSEGRLAPLGIGPESALRPRFERLHFWKVTLRQASLVLLLASAMIIAFVSLRRPAERNGLWFAAAVGLFALGQGDALVRDIPVPTRVWQLTNTAAYLAGIFCVIRGTHLRVGVPAPRVELAAAALAGVVLAAAALLPYRLLPSVTVALLAAMVVGGARIAWAAWRHASARGRAQLAAFGAACLGVGLHDGQAAYSGWSLTSQPMVSYFGVVLAVFGAWLVLDHLIEALAESERLNAVLDRRVAEKHAELEASYQRLRSLERTAGHAEERERILREMHDGMGGQLMATLALVETGRSSPDSIGDSLREAIDEMRLMLDAAEAGPGDVLSVLASLRTRFEPRLARHGLRIEWGVDPELGFPELDPSRSLHLMRIVQEALHNAIRHSRGTTIAVRTGREAQGARAFAFVEVADDGAGMQAAPNARPQHGLLNMRQRAQEMGAELAIASGPSGTTVRIRVPFGVVGAA